MSRPIGLGFPRGQGHAKLACMQGTLPTRDRLVIEAAQLFRRKGYHATGLAEILAASGLPKGSLYHHFPDGKAGLALAAADWTAAVLIKIIDDAFAAAPNYEAGATHYCHKLARLFDITADEDACPISVLLFDGPENAAFRAHAETVFQRLIDAIAAHARRLGMPEAEARAQAETLLITVEGGWTLARARRKSDVLRSLPARLFPGQV
jgi:TetR/AcrR family transcriptional regulator, lmrAB and yxaGH operons repressor